MFTLNLGIIAAFIAFLMWGLGDFFIQRSIKKIGALTTLFWIGVFGGVLLLPFIFFNQLKIFINNLNLLLLVITLIISLVSAIFFFKSLAIGKISVIEPVMSFEVVITALIGIIILKEKVSLLQMILIFIVVLGLVLVIRKSRPRFFLFRWFNKRKLEQGVVLAFIGVVLISLMNVFVGLSSQDIDPIITIWFIHFFIALIIFVGFLFKNKTDQLFKESLANWQLIFFTGFFDISAWLAYALATTRLPISITIAITESYVALAAILGIFINKEKLQKHQFVGIVITLMAAITLAAISG